MTYTETQGHAPFDWRHALTHLEEHTIEDLQDRARSLDTCPLGQLSVDIPRGQDGCPCDYLLHQLGLDFVYQLRNEDIPGCLDTLSRIESRSREVLRDMRNIELSDGFEAWIKAGGTKD